MKLPNNLEDLKSIMKNQLNKCNKLNNRFQFNNPSMFMFNNLNYNNLWLDNNLLWCIPNKLLLNLLALWMFKFNLNLMELQAPIDLDD